MRQASTLRAASLLVCFTCSRKKYGFNKLSLQRDLRLKLRRVLPTSLSTAPWVHLAKERSFLSPPWARLVLRLVHRRPPWRPWPISAAVAVRPPSQAKGAPWGRSQSRPTQANDLLSKHLVGTEACFDKRLCVMGKRSSQPQPLHRRSCCRLRTRRKERQDVARPRSRPVTMQRTSRLRGASLLICFTCTLVEHAFNKLSRTTPWSP